MANIPEFVCPVCTKSKPLTDEYFYRDAVRKNGFKGRCKLYHNLGAVPLGRFTHPVTAKMLAAGCTIVSQTDDVGLLRVEFYPADKASTTRTLRPWLTELAQACDLKISAFGSAEYRTTNGAFVVFFMTAIYHQGTIAHHGAEVRHHG